RPNRLGDTEHATVAVEEDDVDRETHEERVHRPGGTKQHALVRAEAALPEQPTHSRERRVGDHAMLADDSAVEPLNRAFARPLAHASCKVAVGDCRRLERVAHEEIDELDDLLLSSSV